MERRRRRLASVVLMVGASALVASCGDASSDSPPDPAGSTTVTEATDSPSPTSTAGALAVLPTGDPPASDDLEAGTEVPEPLDGLERVWLTSSGVVALESDGTLVVLGDAEPGDAQGDRWRDLTEERRPLGLPEGVTVESVLAESRRTVLVDASDTTGRRAWVRCHVGLLRCAIAGELGPGEVAPQ